MNPRETHPRELPAEPRWLSLGEASRILGVAPSTLRNWADRGIVHCFRTPGGHRRFPPEQIQALRARIMGRQGTATLPPVETILHTTRQALAAQSFHDTAWAQRLPEEAHQHQRHLGRRLLALAVQYLARREGNGEILKQAMALAYEQGRAAAQYGLNAAETIEAFWTCCNTIEHILIPLDPSQAPIDAEQLRLHRELTFFFQKLMQAALLGYEGRHIPSEIP